MKGKFVFSPELFRKINKTHLLLAALCGILLLVITIPTEDGKKKTPESKEIPGASEGKENISEHTYRKNLELQLEKILGDMEGVGKVRVMITLKDMGESVVEKDMTKNEEDNREEDAQGTKRENSVINSKEETIYIQSDSQNSTPFVAKAVNPQVEGVLVVAQGGQNGRVAKNISDAILALFPVQVHKIKVVKMNE